jgi:hypothetical protein
LLRGPLLTEAERWLKDRGDQLSQEERDYIGHGSTLREREQHAGKERRERELRQAQALAETEAKRAEEQQKRAEEQAKAGRKLKGLLAVLAVAAIGLAVFTWITLDQRNKARDLNKIALSRQLVVQSFLNASGNLYHPLLRYCHPDFAQNSAYGQSGVVPNFAQKNGYQHNTVRHTLCLRDSLKAG